MSAAGLQGRAAMTVYVEFSAPIGKRCEVRSIQFDVGRQSEPHVGVGKAQLHDVVLTADLEEAAKIQFWRYETAGVEIKYVWVTYIVGSALALRSTLTNAYIFRVSGTDVVVVQMNFDSISHQYF